MESKPLSKTHPELAKEADGWDPSEVTAGNGTSRKWRCSLGHAWTTSCGNRTNSKSNCPVCAGQKAWPGFNDIATTHPELAKEAHGWDPQQVIAGSNKKLDWICSLGHVWTAVGYSRISGSGCPYCKNQKLLIGFNDLKTTHPEIAKEADGWDPQEFVFGSHKKMPWKCKFGHSWLTSINERTGRDETNCPICSNRKIQSGFNDLLTLNSDLASEAFGWNPSDYGIGSNAVLNWKCTIGHIWKASIHNRASRHSGCPYCSNHKISEGFNDLKTTHPLLAKQADNWDTTKYGPGSNGKMSWKCELNHLWNATINSRVNGNGCPYCSGKKVLFGFNDFVTTHPELAREADGWDPRLYSRGSDEKKMWRCTEGHTWKRSISGRVSGTGCPTCAKYGFNPGKQSFIYLLRHELWEMLQIGITNDPDRRIREHEKRNWVLTELRGPMDGHLAQQWETAILRMLKAKGADLSNPEIAGKFDGYSEAWSKSTFEAKSIKALMKLTEEFESE
jgi:hypothetical protein